MPYNWVRIPSSPPRERRDEVVEICRRHDGRLCDDQIYYDAKGRACALIEVPEAASAQDALLAELGAQHWIGLVDADEHAEGMTPPGSSGD